MNYDDVKAEIEDSDDFANIKNYFLAYLANFIKRYEFKGGFLEGSFRELLLRLIFFETEYQNILYRGPNLFLRIFHQPQIASKHYFNFMALNYCIIVGKTTNEKGLGKKLYRFKENFFRSIRREDRNVETSYFLKGLHIYSFQRKNLVYEDDWEKFKTSLKVEKIVGVKEVEDECCSILSEFDEIESKATTSDSDSQYSLHDSESSEEEDVIYGRIVKKNVSKNIKSLKENIVLGVVFEPFIINTKISDLDFEKIKNMSNDSWICDSSLNLWVEILRQKFPNTYIYDTYFTEVYLNRGFDAVKNWFKKVILITNPRLIFLLQKK